MASALPPRVDDYFDHASTQVNNSRMVPGKVRSSLDPERTISNKDKTSSTQ